MPGPWDEFIEQLFADANAEEAKAMAEMLGDRPRTKARAAEVVAAGMAETRKPWELARELLLFLPAEQLRQWSREATGKPLRKEDAAQAIAQHYATREAEARRSAPSAPRRTVDRPPRPPGGSSASSKARLAQGGKPSTFEAAEALGGTTKHPLVIEGRCLGKSCLASTKFEAAKGQDLGGLAKFVLGIANPETWIRLTTGTGCRYVRCTACGCLQKVCTSCLELCKNTDAECSGCGHAFAT